MSLRFPFLLFSLSLSPMTLTFTAEDRPLSLRDALQVSWPVPPDGQIWVLYFGGTVPARTFGLGCLREPHSEATALVRHTAAFRTWIPCSLLVSPTVKIRGPSLCSYRLPWGGCTLGLKLSCFLSLMAGCVSVLQNAWGLKHFQCRGF